MAKKIKKDTAKEESKFCTPNEIIHGAFIAAKRVIQSNLKDIFLIKLSSINTITPIFRDGEYMAECLFYTYKDSCYYVRISASELKKAINSFLFEPETHWESYGD